MNVLFVCTGNICRSPTAEAVFRARVAAAGLGERIRVDSAGTTAYHVGDPPDPRAQAAAARRGYDMSALRARQVSREDYRDFDLIIALDRSHRHALTRQAPLDARDRIVLLLDFVPGGQKGRDVPDPYYGGQKEFDAVLGLVEEACDALLGHVAQSLAAPQKG